MSSFSCVFTSTPFKIYIYLISSLEHSLHDFMALPILEKYLVLSWFFFFEPQGWTHRFQTHISIRQPISECGRPVTMLGCPMSF